jgi:hypothetical protein
VLKIDSPKKKAVKKIQIALTLFWDREMSVTEYTTAEELDISRNNKLISLQFF